MSDEARMSQSDMLAWRLEQDPMLRSIVVVVALLDASPDWDRFVSTIERMTQALPAMRRKLVPDRGIAPPQWVDDEDFDIDWHVRRFGIAGSRDLDAVLDFARTAGMTAFDPARPMWEYTVLDGLRRDARAALVMKFHHSLTDGIGAVRIAAEVMDRERDGTPRPAITDTAEPIRAASLTDSVRWHAATAVGLLRRTVSTGARIGTRFVVRPVSTTREVAATSFAAARFVRPILDTASPVMTRRSTRRHYAILEVPTANLARAGAAGGGTLNDAFLSAVVLGMRDYHARHGATVDELRVTMPMSLRTADDSAGGNLITLVRFVVPAHIAEPKALIEAVHEIVGKIKLDPAIPLAQELSAGLNLLPAATLGAVLSHVDFLASDVPGSPVPLYIAGAKIMRQYVFGPTTGAAFNVTLMSYCGVCTLGVDIDEAAVIDLPTFVESLREGFARIRQLGRDG